MKTAFASDLLLPIDRKSGVPLRLQVERHLREAVQAGRLQPQSRMPSTRVLSDALGIARGVVVEAYEQLVSEGHLASSVGAGTFVAALRVGACSSSANGRPDDVPLYDFEAGTPDVSSFPKKKWLACLKRALDSADNSVLGYPDAQGLLSARSALAAFLARSRGTAGGPDSVVMCSGGFTRATEVIGRALKARGLTTVAIEDPGYGRLHERLSRMGFDVQCVPLDEHGLVVDRLGSHVSVVIVTPGHQFPTGAAMTVERRRALLAWAERHDALIVEDDYDSEFRYDGQQLGSLQSMASHRVIYVGTASKLLAPGLRLGWLLASPSWARDLTFQKVSTDAGTPINDQLALGEFIVGGDMDRHLRRMRSIYRRRRDAMVAALDEFMPHLRVHGIAAGLHLVVELPRGTDERQLVAQALRRSIRIVGVSMYSAEPGSRSPAMVLGYGCISEENIRHGVRQLARLLAASAG